MLSLSGALSHTKMHSSATNVWDGAPVAPLIPFTVDGHIVVAYTKSFAAYTRSRKAPNSTDREIVRVSRLTKVTCEPVTTAAARPSGRSDSRVGGDGMAMVVVTPVATSVRFSTFPADKNDCDVVTSSPSERENRASMISRSNNRMSPDAGSEFVTVTGIVSRSCGEFVARMIEPGTSRGAAA